MLADLLFCLQFQRNLDLVTVSPDAKIIHGHLVRGTDVPTQVLHLSLDPNFVLRLSNLLLLGLDCLLLFGRQSFPFRLPVSELLLPSDLSVRHGLLAGLDFLLGEPLTLSHPVSCGLYPSFATFLDFPQFLLLGLQAFRRFTALVFFSESFNFLSDTPFMIPVN